MALTTMYNGQVNSPQTTLNGAINSSVTSITVVDGTILPTAPMPLVISEGSKEPETVLMTNKVGNILTVTRAFQGVAQSWGSGASIGRNFTAYDYNTLVENANTINNDLVGHKAESVHQYEELKFSELSSTATNVDSEGVYVNSEWKRADDTTYAKSTLLGVTPNYNQIKIDYYDELGTVIIKTITWNLTYDGNDFAYQREVV